MLIKCIPYSIAKIEFRNDIGANEVTDLNSRRSSYEYSVDETMFSPPKKLKAKPSDSNIRGTSRPETVLSRPYKDIMARRFAGVQPPHIEALMYDAKDELVSLVSQEVHQYPEYFQEGGLENNIEQQNQQIMHYDLPTITSKDFIEGDKFSFTPLRKRNFVFLQSNDGKMYSFNSNKSRKKEYQAQRPPTINVYHVPGNQRKNISYHYGYENSPIPTFQSVSTPDVQIEKVDGRYLNASDSTIPN